MQEVSLHAAGAGGCGACGGALGARCVGVFLCASVEEAEEGGLKRAVPESCDQGTRWRGRFYAACTLSACALTRAFSAERPIMKSVEQSEDDWLPLIAALLDFIGQDDPTRHHALPT